MDHKNYTDEDIVLELNYKLSIRSMQTSVVTIVIAVIGFFGNIFVLMAYWKLYKRKQKQLKGRYFTPYLAVADLIACEVGCFVFLYFDFHRLVFLSNVGCRLSTFSSWSTNAVSVYMLLIISANRYIKVCRPHGKQMTMFWKRMSLVIITVVSLVSCSPFLHFSGVRNVHLKIARFMDVLDLPHYLRNRTVPIHQCATAANNTIPWKIFYNILFLAQMGNIIAMICLYIPMGKIIYEKYRTHKNSASMAYTGRTENRGLGISDTTGTVTSTEPESHSVVQSTDIVESGDTAMASNIRIRSPRGRKQKAWSHAKNRFTIMFLAVVIVYAITNLPTFIFLFMYMENKKFRKYFVDDSHFEVYNLILSLPRIHLINNIVNPFIYGYFDMTFRREVKAICYSIVIQPRKWCCPST